MKCQLCLKYKAKLISLKKFNLSFLEGRTNFRKTSVRDMVYEICMVKQSSANASINSYRPNKLDFVTKQQ